MLKRIIGQLILRYNIGGMRTRLNKANLKISNLQNKLAQEAEINTTLNDVIRNIKFDLEILDSESLVLTEEYKKLQEETTLKSTKLKESHDRKTKYYTEFRNLKCSSKYFLKQVLLSMSLDSIIKFYDVLKDIDHDGEMLFKATKYTVEKFIGDLDIEKYDKISTSNQSKIVALNVDIKDFLSSKSNKKNVINLNSLSYNRFNYIRTIQAILYVYEKNPSCVMESLLCFQDERKYDYIESSL